MCAGCVIQGCRTPAVDADKYVSMCLVGVSTKSAQGWEFSSLGESNSDSGGDVYLKTHTNQCAAQQGGGDPRVFK